MRELKIWIGWVAWSLVLLGSSIALYVGQPVGAPAGPVLVADDSVQPPAKPVQRDSLPPAPVLPTVALSSNGIRFELPPSRIQVTAVATPAPTQRLEVPFILSGGVTESVHYTVNDRPAGDRLVFNPGTSRAEFTIERRPEAPVDAAGAELSIQLKEGSGYRIGKDGSVKLGFPAIWPVLSIRLDDEKVGTASDDQAALNFSLNRALPEDATFRLEYGGSAVPGEDYVKPESDTVTIKANTTAARLGIRILGLGPIGAPRMLEIVVEPMIGRADRGFSRRRERFLLGDHRRFETGAMILVLKTADLGNTHEGLTIAALDRLVQDGGALPIFLVAGDGNCYRYTRQTREGKQVPSFAGKHFSAAYNAAIAAYKVLCKPDRFARTPTCLVVAQGTSDNLDLYGEGSREAKIPADTFQLAWIGSDASPDFRYLDRLYPSGKQGLGVTTLQTGRVPGDTSEERIANFLHRAFEGLAKAPSPTVVEK
jgi:hypothetical protein